MSSSFFTDLLKEYINEIKLDSRGRLSSEEGENFVLKSGGKEPWIKGITSNLKCLSVYRATSTSEIDPVQIIKSMKNPRGKLGIEIPKGTIDEIIEKSVDICLPWLSTIQFDTITTPQSSKTLSIRFAKTISEKTGKKFIPSGTLKDLGSAVIDELPASYSEKSASGLKKSLERMKSSEDRNLQKHFLPRDRKFIRNWQKIRNASDFSKSSNVLLVDDVVSDGSTFVEMERVIRSLGMKVSGCLTIFRTGS
jgi:hypothetical protein